MVFREIENEQGVAQLDENKFHCHSLINYHRDEHVQAQDGPMTCTARRIVPAQDKSMATEAKNRSFNSLAVSVQSLTYIIGGMIHRCRLRWLLLGWWLLGWLFDVLI